VLSPSLCGVLTSLAHWTSETGRAFDPAIGALTAAWDLHGQGRVPSDHLLNAAQRCSGWHRLTLDEAACTLRMPAGMSLDAGAFGKGAALDRLRAAANPASPWLVDLGGQVAVGGAPPGADGWDISVAHPERRDTPVLRLRLSSGSIATSAGSERDLRAGARRIGHILDPRTGRPAEFRGSVTVWHEEALAADVLSTALFVMGPEKGIRWADARSVAVIYLFTDSKGAVVSRASRAFRGSFCIANIANIAVTATIPQINVRNLGNIGNAERHFLNSPHVSICDP
jgi:thiamine biosynthesis lipoprotein